MGSGELVGVGAFAQLSGLTVETLRHYHQVGLLVPAEVGDRTGYRRYRLSQLPRARALAALRDVVGNRMPDGLRRNQRLAAPILTPTTKFEARDRNLGRDDAITEGLVTADLFDRCADVCFRLFARGTELAARRGLILADTKYELGLLGDEIVLIDEVHTPDSSRYWYADTYDELFAKNKDQRALDKEPLREWMAERGFRGDGKAPRHDRRGPRRDRDPLHPTRRGTDPAAVRGPGAHRGRPRCPHRRRAFDRASVPPG